jgi:hypothetical protein
MGDWERLSHSEQRRILAVLLARVEWDGEAVTVSYR